MILATSAAAAAAAAAVPTKNYSQQQIPMAVKDGLLKLLLLLLLLLLLFSHCLATGYVLLPLPLICCYYFRKFPNNRCCISCCPQPLFPDALPLAVGRGRRIFGNQITRTHAPSARGKNVRLQIHSLGRCQGLQRFPHLNSSWDWRLVRKTVGISDPSICNLHIFPLWMIVFFCLWLIWSNIVPSRSFPVGILDSWLLLLILLIVTL